MNPFNKPVSLKLTSFQEIRFAFDAEFFSFKKWVYKALTKEDKCDHTKVFKIVTNWSEQFLFHVFSRVHEWMIIQWDAYMDWNPP